MAKDFYEILGVDRNAADEDIKRAYRRLARKYHPDVNKEAGAEDKFKEIQKAYETLSDSQKRQHYNQFGEEGLGGSGFGGFGGGGFEGFSGGFEDLGGFSDIFDMFFGGEGRSGRRHRSETGPQTGDDLRYDLRIPFEVAVFGKEYTIEISQLVACSKCNGSGAKAGSKPSTCGTCKGSGQVRTAQRTILGVFEQIAVCPNCRGEGKVISNPCPNCHGSGRERKIAKVKVRVPAGVENGTRLRVSGAGNAGLRGGDPGDLYIFIEIEPSADFERKGDDLYSEVMISFVQAALGDHVDIKSPSGKLEIKVPEGTQPGTVLRLRGKGIPHLGGSGAGDHFVKVNVRVPKNINAKQKDALLKMADLFHESLNDASENNEDNDKSSDKKRNFFWEDNA